MFCAQLRALPVPLAERPNATAQLKASYIEQPGASLDAIQLLGPVASAAELSTN
jgi:hypothetical protein